MDLELAALGVARFGQHLVGGLRTRILRILFIVDPVQHNLPRTGKAAHIVDVTVGFIHEHAFRQPDEVRHIQMLGKQGLDLGFGQIRIAIGIEQTFRGGEQRAFTIDMNRAAFQHQRAR